MSRFGEGFLAVGNDGEENTKYLGGTNGELKRAGAWREGGAE
jgi:hypothetical protein